MTIEGDFYKLTPINDYSDLFDLELLYDIGGKNPRKEYKIAAYGIPLDVAIKYVINYSVNKKFSKNTILSLKEYLKEYKITKEEIKKLIS